MVVKELVKNPGYEGGLGGRAWSPGIKVGPWVFLSGMTPVDHASQRTVGRGEAPSPFTPGSPDPEAQWRQVLSNIRDLLATVGGRMEDVVLANVFVTDMHFYYDYEWIRKEFFSMPFPVSTAVEVGSLVHPDWVVEVEVMAYLGDGDR